jgi:UDP-MurNAc hydroxylase
MEVFYLGHAGFLVSHSKNSVIIDPWFSKAGAFNSAWYQFPRNHHLLATVAKKIEDMDNVSIVLSHEHADHFCRSTLLDEKLRKIGIVIPEYRAKGFHDAVRELRGGSVTQLADRQEFRVGTLNISFVIDDSGLDRDAGILVKSDDGTTFLNFNDCKAFDQLSTMRQLLGSIDIFSCQYSGAVRHPICYEYDENHYAQISLEKRKTKFETVRAAIEAVMPRVFVPSAGPCAFLDPMLFDLNFEKRGTIFAKSWNFIDYLETTGCNLRTEQLMPGDALSVNGQAIDVSQTAPAVSAATYAEYMERYQRECWQPPHALRSKSARLENLFLSDLEAKLRVYREVSSDIVVAQTLYFQTAPDELYVKVDFARGEVCKTPEIDEASFFLHKLSWDDIAALYDDGLGWAGHALTFRFSVLRMPDVYDEVIDLFLTSTLEEFRDGVQYLHRLRQQTETIEVTAADGQRFQIRRYCPHQGADLRNARVEGFEVICPRHGWKFNLKDGGICPSRGCDIAAQPL